MYLVLENHISNHFFYGNFPKKDLLIAIAFYKEYAFIKEHLTLLSKQTYQDFDVAIFLEPTSNIEKCKEIVNLIRPKFNVILLQRKEQTGCAGGMYLGQIYAYLKKYSYFILADVDSIPIENDFIKTLFLNRSNKKIVSARERFYSFDKKYEFEIFPPGLFHYSLFPFNMLEKVGFVNAKIFFGYDDLEYFFRFKDKYSRVFINKFVKHPAYSEKMILNPKIILTYIFSGIYFSPFFDFIKRFLNLFFVFLHSLIFKSIELNWFSTFFTLFSKGYGKKFISNLSFNNNIIEVKKILNNKYMFLDLKDFCVSFILRGVGKKLILIHPKHISQVFLFSLVSPEVIVKIKKTHYLFYKSDNIPHFFKLLLFFLGLILLFPLFFFIFSLRIIFGKRVESDE